MLLRFSFRHSHPRWALSLCLIVALGAVAPVLAQDSVQAQRRAASDATVESLFADFLHYAKIGRFTAADAHAKALLAHPELDPASLVELADKNRNSLNTLLILINKSTIGESAARVLGVLQHGEQQRRMDVERIRINIDKLGGDPQQELFAIRNLIESGEYAVPLLLDAFLNGESRNLWPRIVNALPLIGKPAVNPLIAALAVRSTDVRQNVVRALGKIGYPQAVPYLLDIANDTDQLDDTKAMALTAIERIEAITGRSYPGSIEDHFTWLAQKFYDEDDSVRADVRLEQANVWFWNVDSQALRRVEVATKIFGQVMAMRAAQEALRVRNDHSEAIALWLAANIRRESRLGLDVESDDPAQTGEEDATRPEVFPRGLYFTQAAGATYAQMVLDRAIGDEDSAVALGAIRALAVTGGAASLVGDADEQQSLVRALEFSDMMVRFKAALALGAALPKTPFRGADLVVPTLASALAQTGSAQFLVVDPDQNNRARIAGALRDSGHDAIAESSFLAGLQRARAEFQNLSGVFLAADIDEGAYAAVFQLRSEFLFSKTPVVVLDKPGAGTVAVDLPAEDRFTSSVNAFANDVAIIEAMDRASASANRTPIDASTALDMALQAADTLRAIAIDGATVFDHAAAVPQLIGALGSSDEGLQTKAASVLALLSSPYAQRAVAGIALDTGQTETLRVAAFAALAESAKRFGNQLEDNQITELVEIARADDDLIIRTAASRALGAINLSTNQASDIIRNSRME